MFGESVAPPVIGNAGGIQPRHETVGVIEIRLHRGRLPKQNLLEPTVGHPLTQQRELSLNGPDQQELGAHEGGEREASLFGEVADQLGKVADHHRLGDVLAPELAIEPTDKVGFGHPRVDQVEIVGLLLVGDVVGDPFALHVHLERGIALLQPESRQFDGEVQGRPIAVEEQEGLRFQQRQLALLGEAEPRQGGKGNSPLRGGAAYLDARVVLRDLIPHLGLFRPLEMLDQRLRDPLVENAFGLDPEGTGFRLRDGHVVQRIGMLVAKGGTHRQLDGERRLGGRGGQFEVVAEQVGGAVLQVGRHLHRLEAHVDQLVGQLLGGLGKAGGGEVGVGAVQGLDRPALGERHAQHPPEQLLHVLGRTHLLH